MSKQNFIKPKIVFKKDGPIRITNLETLRNSRGESIQTKKTMILCRCGGSKSKPFCDGQHNANGFSDKKSDGKVPDSLDEYRGKNITILDNRGICSHAGFCTSGLPEVWSLKKWSDPEGASKEKIIDTIKKCPSGALSYSLEGKVYSKYHGDKVSRLIFFLTTLQYRNVFFL